MNSRIIRAAGTCGVVLAAVVAAACSSSSTSSSSTPSGSSAKSKPYTVYISNNFVGNDWRGPMEKEATGAARLAPVKGVVQLTGTNTGATAPAHISPLPAISPRQAHAVLVGTL